MHTDTGPISFKIVLTLYNQYAPRIEDQMQLADLLEI